MNVPNEYLADDGWNVNTITFKTSYDEPWQIRNITLVGKTVTVAQTLITFRGAEKGISSSDVRIVKTQLMGSQEVTYSGMARNITIRINSTHYMGWIDVLNDTLSSAGFDYSTSYVINTVKTGPDNMWGVIELKIYYVDIVSIRNAVFQATVE